MRYFSTRSSGTIEYKSFCDVVIEGLAKDGGLYIPEEMPQLAPRLNKGMSY